MNTMIDQSAIVQTMTGLVIFEIGDQEFCADIKSISAIINPVELNEQNPVKQDMKPFVEINNIHIPIISLHAYFNQEFRENNQDQRILIIEPDDVMFGFYVDKVKEIYTMNRDFKNRLTFLPAKDSYFAGIISYEDRKLYLPDFNKILSEKN